MQTWTINQLLNKKIVNAVFTVKEKDLKKAENWIMQDSCLKGSFKVRLRNFNYWAAAVQQAYNNLLDEHCQ